MDVVELWNHLCAILTAVEGISCGRKKEGRELCGIKTVKRVGEDVELCSSCGILGGGGGVISEGCVWSAVNGVRAHVCRMFSDSCQVLEKMLALSGCVAIL